MELSGKISVAARTTTTTTTIQPSLLLDCSVPIVSSNVDVPEVTMAAAERIPAQRILHGQAIRSGAETPRPGRSGHRESGGCPD